MAGKPVATEVSITLPPDILAGAQSLLGNLADALNTDDGTITISREEFDATKAAFKTLNEAMDAAETKIKADEQAAHAQEKGDAVMKNITGGQQQPGDLSGFPEQLNTASNFRIGLQP